ncbi:hypothetical protein FRACA_780032 [Frankia canadensis]|uniref:Uncharacterized protein n=1 Tax=Frankia canadensis TaxID=1836972 RepID=A0A2I2L189_9ACTN|nr:hypothetical protein FRACA_780032 [Frankia canadensis]SOU58965.1 hypothetical protein FRACA_780032 [Frankia canadensis]
MQLTGNAWRCVLLLSSGTAGLTHGVGVVAPRLSTAGGHLAATHDRASEHRLIRAFPHSGRQTFWLIPRDDTTR